MKSRSNINFEFIQGEKSGTIVFLHGNSSSMKVFDEIFGERSPEYSLLRFDLQGHGDSYHSENIEGYSYDAYCKTIAELIQPLKGDILLVGNSLGGHLAFRAAYNIERLNGLVIMGTSPIKNPPNFEEAFLPFPESQNMFTEHVDYKEVNAMFNLACSNKSVVPLLTSDFQKADPLLRPAMLNEVMKPDFEDEVDLLLNLKTKKVVIAPLNDPSVNMEYVKGLSEDLEIIEIPDCGHYPSLERPEEFKSAVMKIANEVFA